MTDMIISRCHTLKFYRMLATQLTAPYRLVHPATVRSMLICKESAAHIWTAGDISPCQLSGHNA